MSHMTIAFEVEELRQTRAEMEKRGVEFVGDVEATSDVEAFAYFRGHDGYLFEIWRPADSDAMSLGLEWPGVSKWVKR
ncbi:MAG: VOC family protein [Chloroflexota bacterium]|nr:MAG: VOC family protein [Chloroflexota bacterium]